MDAYIIFTKEARHHFQLNFELDVPSVRPLIANSNSIIAHLCITQPINKSSNGRWTAGRQWNILLLFFLLKRKDIWWFFCVLCYTIDWQTNDANMWNVDLSSNLAIIRASPNHFDRSMLWWNEITLKINSHFVGAFPFYAIFFFLLKQITVILAQPSTIKLVIQFLFFSPLLWRHNVSNIKFDLTFLCGIMQTLKIV